jgi:diguanylate cyclase (GGDEF)-like protein/PAS domain S-box-containing protein
MAHDDGWWPMATLDMSGRFVDANTAFALLLGCDPDDLVGQRVLDVLDREQIAPELTALERLRAGELIVHYAREHTLPTGLPWAGHAQLSLVRGADGEPELVHLRLTQDVARRPPDRIAWNEGSFSLALDEMRVGVAIIGLDGTPLRVNRALCEIVGLSEAEMLATDLLSLTHPDDRSDDVELGTRAWLGEIDSYTIEKRIIRPDGRHVHVRQEVTFAHDADGELLHLIGQVIDISDRKEAELALAASRQELDDLIRAMPLGLVHIDEHARVLSANPAAAAIAGVPAIERGSNVFDLVHPDDLERILAEVPALVEAGEDYHVEFRLVRPDGAVRWVRNDARPILDEDGVLVGVSGTWLDMTDLKAAEDDLRHHATHDNLTGLANRRVVFRELAAAIGRCGAADHHLSVLYIDLDGFKEVNDAHGHQVGDLVLGQVAERLRSTVAGVGLAGRIGGDEFVVVVETDGVPADEHARRVEALATAAIDAIAAGLRCPEGTVTVGASVGIADWVPGRDADALISAADRGVYEAKRAGRARWHRA